MPLNAHEKYPGAGRPPKFREERRPVSMTLPLRVLEILKSVNSDRARAVVKLAEAAGGEDNRKLAEIVEVAPRRGLIVVAKSRILESIEGLHLVEIAPGRYLITVKANLSLESIEVQVEDKIEEETEDLRERKLLKELLSHIRHQRRRRAVSKEELLVISI